jgi:hypothetical protein
VPVTIGLTINRSAPCGYDLERELGAFLSLYVPGRLAGHHLALRLSAEPLQVRLVLELLQSLEKRRGSGLAEGTAGQAHEFIR